MATVLYDAHYAVSSTDVLRQWGIKSSAGHVDVVEVIEKVTEQSFKYRAIEGDIPVDTKSEICKMLGDTNVIGFSWLLKPEADIEINELVPAIGKILFLQDYLSASEKEQFLLENTALSQQKICEIASKTVGQHKN